MTHDEINKAIAEACGFEADYCYDLNAMHEAESWLKNEDQHVFSCYAIDLFDEHGIDAIHLSAYQRAKSFLRYINPHTP